MDVDVLMDHGCCPVEVVISVIAAAAIDRRSGLLTNFGLPDLGLANYRLANFRLARRRLMNFGPGHRRGYPRSRSGPAKTAVVESLRHHLLRAAGKRQRRHDRRESQSMFEDIFHNGKIRVYKLFFGGQGH